MSQRDDLLAGAKKLLVEKGYHRTTARDLAAASGAHLASIGYHFGSKDALMTTATLQAQGEWGDTIDTTMAASGAEIPAERLRICVDALVAAMAGQREVLVASVQAYAQAAFDNDIREVLTTATAETRATMAAASLDIDPQELDAETVRGLGSVLHALVAGLSLQAFLDPESLPTGDQVVRAVRILAGDQPD
ncbi:TetR/AcrR family transcriptional regulator [Actinopolymorpha alba]|uniref:TetR/AcrR family transcriptional regulator n=1 Tax=Actinopolymorpha alba TaxID=533267 RepID=UPI00036FEE3D|nr:TetR/AcrR family transcriptional regulator [Actinopolymorpha alba]